MELKTSKKLAKILEVTRCSEKYMQIKTIYIHVVHSFKKPCCYADGIKNAAFTIQCDSDKTYSKKPLALWDMVFVIRYEEP